MITSLTLASLMDSLFETDKNKVDRISNSGEEIDMVIDKLPINDDYFQFLH